MTHPDRRPIERNADGYYSTHWAITHPRLRAEHRLGDGWTIKVGRVYINPRRIEFHASTKSSNRRFYATQDYGSTFVEIIERDGIVGNSERLFHPDNEPEIARFILSAFDIQFPQGPRGVKKTGQS